MDLKHANIVPKIVEEKLNQFLVNHIQLLYDEYLIAGSDHYKWDYWQGKKEEPLTLKVIMPFYDSD